MCVSRAIRCFLLLGFLTIAALASEVTGDWKGKSDAGPEYAFTFKSEGEKVTGVMLNAEGKQLPIKDGKLEGDSLSFSVDSEWQGQPIRLIMKGTVSRDTIKLRIDTDNGYWGTDVLLKRSSS